MLPLHPLLVHSENAYDQAENVVAMLGQATGACRCYWTEIREDPGKGIMLTRQAVWRVPGEKNRYGTFDLQSIYEHPDSGWHRQLSANRMVSGMIADFPEQVRKMLQDCGVKSILVVPMFIVEQYIGFIGLDNCAEEKFWGTTEVNLLRFGADSLAKAFDREKSFHAG